MISFLSDWIEQVTIAVIIVSIIELILPSGNIKKYIKIVLGIYVIFSIISPFVDSSSLYEIGSIDSYVDNLTSNEEITNQTSMDTRIQELYIEQLESDIKSRVEEKGYKVSSCDVDADLDSSSESAGIHKINLSISKNQTNIEDVEVEISTDDTDETTNNEEVEEIKQSLATTYEISEDIINIKLK